MAASEQMLGLVQKRSVPAGLLALAGVCLLLSFAVGWYSVDVVLRTFERDDANTATRTGDQRATVRVDLEMHMLSIETHANPRTVEDEIRSRGEPSYDDHAGRLGTLMLGMLMMQFANLIAFASVFGFYYLQRRSHHDYGRVLRRLFVVFFAITVLSLAYFAVRVGDLADQDVAVILDRNPLGNAAYEPFVPDLGFWQEWRSDYQPITREGQREMWQFTVSSNASAGWILTAAAGLLALGARLTASRFGQLDRPAPEEPAPEPTTKPASG